MNHKTPRPTRPSGIKAAITLASVRGIYEAVWRSGQSSYCRCYSCLSTPSLASGLQMDSSLLRSREYYSTLHTSQSRRLCNYGVSVDRLLTAFTLLNYRYIRERERECVCVRERMMVSVNIRHRQTMNQLHLPTQIGQRFYTSLIS